MNKKITVKRSDGKVMCCILSDDQDFEKQFNVWLFGAELPTGGYKAKFYGNSLEIIDCVAYDTVENFDVLSIKDTKETISTSWTYL